MSCTDLSRHKIWLGCLAAVLDLYQNGLSPFNLSNTGKVLVLARRGSKRQTRHNHLIARGGESRGYFFVVTGGVSVHLYVTSAWHLCVS